MNVFTLISLRKLLLPGMCVAMLTQCDRNPPVVESPPTPAELPEMELPIVEEEEETPPAVLEDVIQGVWQSSNMDRLDSAPEKIQIDFRANGELTMIVYQRGQSQQEGRYEVSGNSLTLQIEGQEEDAIKTTFDGKTLTIIDVDNEDEVAFTKL